MATIVTKFVNKEVSLLATKTVKVVDLCCLCSPHPCPKLMLRRYLLNSVWVWFRVADSSPFAVGVVQTTVGTACSEKARSLTMKAIILLHAKFKDPKSDFYDHRFDSATIAAMVCYVNVRLHPL